MYRNGGGGEVPGRLASGSLLADPEHCLKEEFHVYIGMEGVVRFLDDLHLDPSLADPEHCLKEQLYVCIGMEGVVRFLDDLHLDPSSRIRNTV